ncbi:MAG: tRNA preQ1(34) S-adenosylmethionine ribosyltransferase-isomerase QueA [Candidatus Krumholzibacteriota bacterium]|nr:tRNA preQ1(34) S-adenosylmethionine ribosyltransferase-isomerase QueA [Candidatus Krumholzibacteriota bacterium]
MSERLSDYDYELPRELVAQRPLAERAASRLLCLDPATGALADRAFRDLPGLLAAGDLLVVNDTRVLAARFLGRRAGGGGVAEVFLHSPGAEGRWQALVRPSRRFRPGDRFEGEGGVVIRVEEPAADGSRWVALEAPASWETAMDRAGRVPLPPYITRPADARDREDYQTRFARADGAVAAPTAGLHFDADVLAALAARGVATAALTLHVGPGTFQPVRVEDPARHRMHAERFLLPAGARRAIDDARAAGGRVVAVGTTATRCLEAVGDADWASDRDLSGATRLFIRPPHDFRRVDALLTNFHLPRSTLLMLVSAFAGRERILAAYRHAVAERYRFYSYGDAMLIMAGAAP